MKYLNIIFLKTILVIIIVCGHTLNLPVKCNATSILDLNSNYNIDELSYNEAICHVAMAQVGATGSELNAVEGWCGDLILSCAIRCGIDSDVIPITGSPRDMYYGILNNGGKLIGWDYRAGDIAYYPFQGENGHIAIIVGDGSAVHGNIGDTDYHYSRVVQREFLADENVIIIRPPYKEYVSEISTIDYENGTDCADEILENDGNNENYEITVEPYYIYVALDKDKHTPGLNPKIENIVQPDCFNYGSYEKVIYCKDCGIELVRTKETVSMIYHHPVNVNFENLGENPIYQCEYCNTVIR